ncbi:MAG: hypothetical protein OXE77_08080 [Flavobacteriaceae bacterium]|nr:hypothetical protein [Flavobacteriaceae bacterium]MCY4267061.1 hypothetical protein [Flavobacteriaceae bacterium]MCY4299535.1 hypothetical protein [Flavobacteriaceae bacterium]
MFENKVNDAPNNHYRGFMFFQTPIITNQDASVIELGEWGLTPP